MSDTSKHLNGDDMWRGTRVGFAWGCRVIVGCWCLCTGWSVGEFNGGCGEKLFPQGLSCGVHPRVVDYIGRGSRSLARVWRKHLRDSRLFGCFSESRRLISGDVARCCHVTRHALQPVPCAGVAFDVCNGFRLYFFSENSSFSFAIFKSYLYSF